MPKHALIHSDLKHSRFVDWETEDGSKVTHCSEWVEFGLLPRGNGCTTKPTVLIKARAKETGQLVVIEMPLSVLQHAFAAFSARMHTTGRVGGAPEPS